jgi:hypothetical protein
MHWGVDSARSSNTPALDGATLAFDAVTNRAGQPPEFWGRYIGGNYSLTATEAAFLHAANCKILLTYNGTSNSAGSVQGGFAEGQQDAATAIAAAQALTVPAGTAIYADVEGDWNPTSDWIRGWATAVAAANFTPGLYCDPTHGSTFDIAYCVASAAEPIVTGMYLWALHPEPNPQCMAAGAAPAFGPYTPSCGGNSFLWQYTEDCWEDLLGVRQGIDMDQANDSAFNAMW